MVNLPLLYLIVPWNSTISIEGVMTDDTVQAQKTGIDFTIGPLDAPPPQIPTPEPATIALALAASSLLLARRARGSRR